MVAPAAAAVLSVGSSAAVYPGAGSGGRRSSNALRWRPPPGQPIDLISSRAMRNPKGVEEGVDPFRHFSWYASVPVGSKRCERTTSSGKK